MLDQLTTNWATAPFSRVWMSKCVLLTRAEPGQRSSAPDPWECPGPGSGSGEEPCLPMVLVMVVDKQLSFS